MPKRDRRSYDNEFRREAVLLVIKEGRKVSEVKRNLGITPILVSRWVREMKEDPEYAFHFILIPRHLWRKNKIEAAF